MIYFSEINLKKVVSEDYIEIGRLEDMIFTTSEIANITKLVIRNNLNEKLIIPVKYLDKINKQIIISKEYQTKELEQNELFIVKNLLDKQIIDIKGNKIVRVNDILIQDKGEPAVIGVDIGILGILRWLKLANTITRFFSFLRIPFQSKSLAWADIQPLELTRGKVKMKTTIEKLKKIKSEDLASYLDKTNFRNVRKFIRLLDEDKSSRVIPHLNINMQTSLFNNYEPEQAAKLINIIDPDDAVDVIFTLSSRRREQILKLLPIYKRTVIERLLKLSTDSVGRFVTPEILLVKPHNTANEVIQKIKNETQEYSILVSIFVINDEEKLVGVFNLHELLLQSPDTQVYKFMITNVIVVHLSTPEEIVIKKMIKYRISCIPVIDNNNHIVGMVSMDDIAKYIIGKFL